MKKIISLLLLTTFLLQTTSGYPYSVASIKPLGTTTSAKREKQAAEKEIFIPEQFGQIESNTEFVLNARNSDRSIVIIKDAHCIYEAQHNIAKILEILIRDYDIDLVTVEGAEGELDAGIFGQIADKEIKEEAFDSYVQKGYLNGPEFLRITQYNTLPFTIYGMEDGEIYVENYTAFRKTWENKNKTELFLREVRGLMGKLKKLIYPPDLLAFDTKLQEYENNELGLTDWLILLRQWLPENAELSSWTYFNLAIKAIRLEEKTDFQQVKRERKKLISRLEKTLPREELAQLVEYSLNLKSGQIAPLDYYSFIEQYLPPPEVDPTAFSELRKYIRLVKLQADIDQEGLFDDLDSITGEIENTLGQSDLQAKLIQLCRRISVLERLFQLRLTRKQFNQLLEEGNLFLPTEIVPFLQVLAAHYELKMPPLLANEQFLAQVDQTILPAADFYRLAVERDHLLVENTLALMEVEGKQRAAMVVGGFHADGIKRLLAREGINYLLITPTISKTPLDNPYLSIMLDERIHCPQTDDSSPALANPVVISETPPGPITEMAADLAGTLRHEAYQRLIELVRDKDELRSPGERFSEELQLLSGLDLEAVKAAIALIENDSGIKDARIKLAELRSLAEVLAARIADQTTPAEDIEEDQPAAVRSDQSFRAGAIYIGILAAAFISIIIPAFLGVPLAITIANNLLYAYLPVVMPIILLFYQSYRANILAGEAGTAASPLDEYWEIRLKFGWLLAPFVYIHELTHRVLGKSEFAAYTVEILAIIISAPVIIAAVFCALVYRLVQMMARKHPAFIVYLFLYAPLVICLTVLLPSVIGFTGTIGFAFSATMVPALGGIFLPNRAERPQPSLPAVIFSPNKHLVINKLSPLDFIDISFSGVDKDRARLTIKAAKDGSGYEFYANGSLSGKFLFKEKTARKFLFIRGHFGSQKLTRAGYQTIYPPRGTSITLKIDRNGNISIIPAKEGKTPEIKTQTKKALAHHFVRTIPARHLKRIKSYLQDGEVPPDTYLMGALKEVKIQSETLTANYLLEIIEEAERRINRAATIKMQTVKDHRSRDALSVLDLLEHLITPDLQQSYDMVRQGILAGKIAPEDKKAYREAAKKLYQFFKAYNIVFYTRRPHNVLIGALESYIPINYTHPKALLSRETQIERASFVKPFFVAGYSTGFAPPTLKEVFLILEDIHDENKYPHEYLMHQLATAAHEIRHQLVEVDRVQKGKRISRENRQKFANDQEFLAYLASFEQVTGYFPSLFQEHLLKFIFKYWILGLKHKRVDMEMTMYAMEEHAGGARGMLKEIAKRIGFDTREIDSLTFMVQLLSDNKAQREKAAQALMKFYEAICAKYSPQEFAVLAGQLSRQFYTDNRRAYGTAPEFLDDRNLQIRYMSLAEVAPQATEQDRLAPTPLPMVEIIRQAIRLKRKSRARQTEKTVPEFLEEYLQPAIEKLRKRMKEKGIGVGDLAYDTVSTTFSWRRAAAAIRGPRPAVNFQHSGGPLKQPGKGTADLGEKTFRRIVRTSQPLDLNPTDIKAINSAMRAAGAADYADEKNILATGKIRIYESADLPLTMDAYGKVQNGILHIIVRSDYTNYLLQEGLYYLGLAEIIDHEWGEQVEQLSHRQAAQRQRGYRREKGLTVYHEWVINRKMTIDQLQAIVAEYQDPTTDKTGWGDYEDTFYAVAQERLAALKERQAEKARVTIPEIAQALGLNEQQLQKGVFDRLADPEQDEQLALRLLILMKEDNGTIDRHEIQLLLDSIDRVMDILPLINSLFTEESAKKQTIQRLSYLLAILKLQKKVQLEDEWKQAPQFLIQLLQAIERSTTLTSAEIKPLLLDLLQMDIDLQETATGKRVPTRLDIYLQNLITFCDTPEVTSLCQQLLRYKLAQAEVCRELQVEQLATSAGEQDIILLIRGYQRDKKNRNLVAGLIVEYSINQSEFTARYGLQVKSMVEKIISRKPALESLAQKQLKIAATPYRSLDNLIRQKLGLTGECILYRDELDGKIYLAALNRFRPGEGIIRPDDITAKEEVTGLLVEQAAEMFDQLGVSHKLFYNDNRFRPAAPRQNAVPELLLNSQTAVINKGREMDEDLRGQYDLETTIGTFSEDTGGLIDISAYLTVDKKTAGGYVVNNTGEGGTEFLRQMKKHGKQLKYLYLNDAQKAAWQLYLEQHGIETAEDEFQLMTETNYAELEEALNQAGIKKVITIANPDNPENSRFFSSLSGRKRIVMHDDLVLATRVAAFLGTIELTQELADMKNGLRTIFSAYYKDSPYADQIEEFLANVSWGWYLTLPPMVPFLKDHYNALRTARELLLRSA